MSIIIGIDHGYYAIKTAHCSFPAGLTSYVPYALLHIRYIMSCKQLCKVSFRK